MRLSNKQIRAIKKYFKECFGEGEIYLFGSRADDSKRGGDIDLYISTPNRDNLTAKKLNFLVRLKRAIGEQKIDVVLDWDKELERNSSKSFFMNSKRLILFQCL